MVNNCWTVPSNSVMFSLCYCVYYVYFFFTVDVNIGNNQSNKNDCWLHVDNKIGVNSYLCVLCICHSGSLVL